MLGLLRQVLNGCGSGKGNRDDAQLSKSLWRDRHGNKLMNYTLEIYNTANERKGTS